MDIVISIPEEYVQRIGVALEVETKDEFRAVIMKLIEHKVKIYEGDKVMRQALADITPITLGTDPIVE